MPGFPAALGEKFRPGGQLPVAVFLAAVCGSIPAPRRVLPSQYRRANLVLQPLSSSCFLFLDSFFSLRLRVYLLIMVAVSRCAPFGGAHLDTATRLGRSPELIPVSVTVGLIDGAEVAKAAFGPELAATFEATLALAAG